MASARSTGAAWAAAVLLMLTGPAALAHGDHAPPQRRARAAEEKRPAPVADGERIYLAKEVQFLVGVRTEPAAVEPVQSRLVVPGRVVPRNDLHAQIFAPVAGRILPPPRGRIPLVGERVKKGQTLALVQQSLSAPETAQLSAARIKAQAELESARARLAQARRDLERQQSLRGVVAEKEIQAAALAVRVAEQEVERAARERALYGASDASSGDGVSRFALLAPLDGVVAEAHATVGEQVDPSRSLFTILDSRVVWVEANVFAGDVARVEAAREAVIHVEAYPGIDFHAPLINLGQLVDEATRTVRAIFEARNPDGKLRPGMFAEVAIGSGAPEHLLAVPLSALVEEGARRVVFVKVGPEHFVEREVKTGPRDGEHVAILGGLVEGELVVIQGVYQLRTAEH